MNLKRIHASVCAWYLIELFPNPFHGLTCPILPVYITVYRTDSCMDFLNTLPKSPKAIGPTTS